MPIADFSRELERVSENIEASDEILNRNKDLILNYKQDRVLDGLSEATLLRNTQRLKKVAEQAEKPFDEMEKRDVKGLVTWVHEQDYTDETVDTYKSVIKAFWSWLKDAEQDETPPEVKWIKLSNGNGNGDTLPKDLLTKEDIEAQVNAAKNPRDKAFIYLLYETGARIGELIDLTVGDIEDRANGKKVVIEGKTGARRLPLVESVPHLNNWLNKHPNPEKDAPLWCKIQQGGPTKHLNPNNVDDIRDIHGIGPSRAEQLNDAGIETGRDLVNHSAEDLADIVSVNVTTAEKWLRQFDSDATLTSEMKLGYRYLREKILAATMERAGIDKPSNPHHYRHSRASYLATEMTEAQLCEWFGWVQGSDVPAKYVHLSGRDIDNAYDEMHGLYEPDEEEETPDVVECDRCQELNEPSASYCMRCGFALDQETAAEFEEQAEQDVKEDYRDTEPSDTETVELLDAFDDALDDPEFKEELLKRISD
ncbi:tyrosine-type recombinase/integrase [Natronomonas gomsonensis]|uniref:tyrosine-type recombinase/integrase n=1 Tax=Natronomonas gomsonensis TaxID=1046043 RepID=UPI0020CA2846|nr:tyrosine-type recombinase/integrase [Natronomonas gomsonensis]MCY4731924.1 tyrosine-type recombinase/integrase [Natronomonas gomsonensis]